MRMMVMTMMLVISMLMVVMTMQYISNDDDNHLERPPQLVSNHLVVPIGQHVLGEPDNEDDNFDDEKTKVFLMW